MTIGPDGHLWFGGCNLVTLAEEFGTPLYLINENTIRRNCDRYKQAAAEYPHDFSIAYASKAFLCQAICRIIASMGLNLDVVSLGELYTALSSDFPAERIIFHGVNRSREELRIAIQRGVGRIVVDNFFEIEKLVALAAEMQREVNLLIRVASGVQANTHEYVQTSITNSKFGFNIADLPQVFALCHTQPLLKVRGFHSHTGSQILTLQPFIENLQVMLKLLATWQERIPELSELNVGGGLGSYYTNGDPELSIEEYMAEIIRTAKDTARELGIALPRLTVEPGRSIINEAGLTLYRVGGTKVIAGMRKYVFVDGSMADNIRPALYGSNYEAALANRALEPATETVSIAGRCCESGDMLVWETKLPAAAPDDLLVVGRTGAYTYSMASNYNRLPRPAVVLITSSKAELIVRGESWTDLTRFDLIPEHLR
ncbi:MAG: diaminopimelate decarboxylase [Firmicutes bacterium]|nr:diaminopimelate decarboxylase [Bacillota bacterium]